MSFRTKQIRKKPPRKPLQFFNRALKSGLDSLKKPSKTPMPKKQSKSWHYAWGSMLVIFGVFIVFKVTFAAYDFVSNISLGDVATAVGEELEKDSKGRTNILLMGDGGYERDGAGLVDSFINVSIDWEKGTVAMVSIPRDFYVDRQFAKVPGRINSLYVLNGHLDHEERFELYKEVAAGVLGLEEVHYYIRIDFNGFVEVVDSLGGIMVDVQQSIYDDRYPNETDTGYTLFRLDSGLQELDGETALKYARTRHSGAGDFDRAARQQQLLEAIRQKALSRDALKLRVISGLYNAIQENMDTDLDILEMVELAGFANDFNRNHLAMTVLHDDPGREGGGGFLAAGSMELYGGYTLLPYDGSLDSIHTYTNLLFDYPTLFSDTNAPKIEVLNATGQAGLANQLAYQLNRFGFDVIKVGNYEDAEGERKNLEKSLFIYYPTQEQLQNDTSDRQIELLLEVLPKFTRGIPLGELGVTKGQGDFLTIVLGEDYKFYTP